ncbi:unnamed protein product [Orchesella dallaii]|uniref:Uncharacterized protein n=1 Tax=Orchesella dallaii TaxID=48710 RepID=A0ABP1PYP0_9HEXA
MQGLQHTTCTAFSATEASNRRNGSMNTCVVIWGKRHTFAPIAMKNFSPYKKKRSMSLLCMQVKNSDQ